MNMESKKRSISITSGSIYNTNSYGRVVVLEVRSYKEVLVRFLNTGNEQVVAGGSLVIGGLVDKKLFNDEKLMYVGKICQTKSSGAVEVLKVDAQNLRLNGVSAVKAEFRWELLTWISRWMKESHPT